MHCYSISMENEGILSNFSGVRKRKWGNYVAEKWDPIKKNRVWLSTFNTAEEVSVAYLAKHREFAQTPASAYDMFDEMPSSNSTSTSAASAHHMLDEMLSSNSTIKSVADHGKKPFITEISFRDRRPLLGMQSKQVCKGFNMHESEKLVKVNQGKEPIICVESSKQTSSKSSDDGCNNVTRNHKSKSGLLGIRKQKNGRYGVEIRDPIKHKQVWLGTFDTVEEAKQAYLSKKSEFDMLIQGNNKENKPKNCDQTLHAASVGKNKRIDSLNATRIVGVNKNKWGKYTSEIIDPISKKKIWLGTFGTYEEASQAYQSKKLEFQKLVKPKKKCNKKTHPTAREKQLGKEKLVNVNQGHVNCEGFQPESAAEETFHANQYMKFDVQRSKEAELQSNMPIQEDADLWMGQWVQLPGGKEVKFSLKLGLPIIDNYGSLLGEFSCLDNPQYILDGGCDDE